MRISGIFRTEQLIVSDDSLTINQETNIVSSRMCWSILLFEMWRISCWTETEWLHKTSGKREWPDDYFVSLSLVIYLWLNLMKCIDWAERTSLVAAERFVTWISWRRCCWRNIWLCCSRWSSICCCNSWSCCRFWPPADSTAWLALVDAAISGNCCCCCCSSCCCSSEFCLWKPFVRYHFNGNIENRTDSAI